METLSEKEQLLSRSEFFRSCVRRRSWLAWSIVISSIALVTAFTVVTRFLPSLANAPVHPQGVATVGIVAGFVIIIVIAAAAFYFIHWNNREHARLSYKIREQYLDNTSE